MRGKKILIFGLAAVFCVGVAARIWSLNRDRENVETVVYQMGETVDLGEDFFYNPEDICSDYDIRVLSAQVLSVGEYLEKHGFSAEEVWPDTEPLATTVYDVEVWFRNNHRDFETDTQRIDLVNMELFTNQDSYQVDHELLWSLYPQLDQSRLGFRVAPGTETVVHLPYTDSKLEKLSTEEIRNRDTYLLLSMYPTKRVIQIHPDS